MSTCLSLLQYLLKYFHDPKYFYLWQVWSVRRKQDPRLSWSMLGQFLANTRRAWSPTAWNREGNKKTIQSDWVDQSANLGHSLLLAQLHYNSCNYAARGQTEGSEEDTTSLSKVLHHDSLYVHLDLEQVDLLLVGTVQGEDVPGLPQLGLEWSTLIGPKSSKHFALIGHDCCSCLEAVSLSPSHGGIFL